MNVLIPMAILAYLIGSIPFGFLVARMAGVDIRRVGSGNIGATNVLRTLGKPYGYLVFGLDFLKGMVAVILSILIVNHFRPDFQRHELIGIICGGLCVIGHSYPIWLGFKGGKGVATSAGVVFGLMPLVAVIVLFVWLLIYQTTKYVSVASIGAALVLPVTTFTIVHFQQTGAMILVYFAICLTLVVVWRHRSNISRLAKGTETTFRRK